METQLEQWVVEFREYFDMNLKPKTATMKNLDREICVDFIKKLLKTQHEQTLEILGQKKQEILELFCGYPVDCNAETLYKFDEICKP